MRAQNLFGGTNNQINLHDVRFVSPSGMLLLAATCYSLHQQGRPPLLRFSPYKNTHVPGYLLRANFVASIKPVAQLDIKFKERWVSRYADLQGHNQMLIEVTRLQAGGELPGLLNRFVDVLIGTSHYAPLDAYRIATAVSEAGQNTFQHNTSTFGFFAMQVYREAKQPFLEIAISDCGDGYLTSLRRHPAMLSLESDHDAIAQAVQPGTSEFDDPARGHGLASLLEIVARARGSVQIWSGSAIMRIRAGQIQATSITTPHMPGVHLTLKLPALPTP
jgi:anti-sigma regulatory factor (Ser/Thr protein kinase)